MQRRASSTTVAATAHSGAVSLRMPTPMWDVDGG